MDNGIVLRRRPRQLLRCAVVGCLEGDVPWSSGRLGKPSASSPFVSLSPRLQSTRPWPLLTYRSIAPQLHLTPYVYTLLFMIQPSLGARASRYTTPPQGPYYPQRHGSYHLRAPLSCKPTTPRTGGVVQYSCLVAAILRYHTAESLREQDAWRMYIYQVFGVSNDRRFARPRTMSIPR